MPNGAGEKSRRGDWREPLRLSTRKGWVPNRPLIRPSVRTGAPSPRGEGFGGGCFPLGYPPSHRFTRQGTPRRVSPPAGGKRKSNHVLTGFAGQNILLTPRVPAPPARFGVHPPILGAQRSGSQNSCLSQPAQPVGGPLRALDYGPQARQKKREDPRRVPQTRKGGSREEEPLPPWCSFLRLSSKESRAPARGRAGNGALRPEAP